MGSSDLLGPPNAFNFPSYQTGGTDDRSPLPVSPRGTTYAWETPAPRVLRPAGDGCSETGDAINIALVSTRGLVTRRVGQMIDPHFLYPREEPLVARNFAARAPRPHPKRESFISRATEVAMN
jgi:hypothetical protein